MRRTRKCTIGAVAAALALASLLATALPAGAGRAYVEHWVDEWSEETEMCGLEVLDEGWVSGTLVINQRGRDNVPYFGERVRGTTTVTNLANDKTYTHHFTVNEKDLSIIDNGDGTMTIQVLATGGMRVVGPDGKLLFRDPGQIRWEVLIDHGGTMDDPFDDEFLEFLGFVKGSTGLNELAGRDFCQDLQTYIG
jgi:hypothetical protein